VLTEELIHRFHGLHRLEIVVCRPARACLFRLWYLRNLWILIPLVLGGGPARAEDQRETTVGMPARIDQLVLPGTELEVKPNEDRRSPMVLRIVSAYPHGTAFRYDLAYYGLDAGTFDLKDYLRRKDASSAADLPALKVTIRATLPPGQILPNPLETRSGPALGGYRLALWLGGGLWCAGLLAILFVGRRRKAATAALSRPLTVAERLRPLVEQAMAGTLSAPARAELERTLLAFWRQRLGLADAKPAEAFALLREHAEAGPLVRQLEIWLHRPGTGAAIDVSALLRPYAA
jgi:hypothetical protein